MSCAVRSCNILFLDFRHYVTYYIDIGENSKRISEREKGFMCMTFSSVSQEGKIMVWILCRVRGSFWITWKKRKMACYSSSGQRGMAVSILTVLRSWMWSVLGYYHSREVRVPETPSGVPLSYTNTFDYALKSNFTLVSLTQVPGIAFKLRWENRWEEERRNKKDKEEEEEIQFMP